MILAGTNILLRSLETSAPQYRVVESALAKLRSRSEALCIAPQNLVEFWSVATRPVQENGLGMDRRRADAEIATLLKLFRLLRYRPEVLKAWRSIILDHAVSGKRAHDAHLVAMMQVHSVSSILTFNGPHFRRYPAINVIEPESVTKTEF